MSRLLAPPKPIVRTTHPFQDVIAEYRHLLAQPAAPPWIGMPWQPVVLGPTWKIEDGHWVLPEWTLGWDVLAFCGIWMQHGRDRPWRFTLEQARFILWWYALDEEGDFLFRDFVLQRLKGWGKDPLGATLCGVEMVGPCRFDGWDRNHQPLSIDCPDAWVQTAAVALDQTRNTMRLFPSLWTPEAKKRFRLQIGKEVLYALNDERMIQALTSSPTTLEGARATLLIKNETQHWDSSNGGHEMAAVIERNATKSSDGAARTGAITNAYEPGRDSVGERDREAYEAVQRGEAEDTGLLYDSLEAPPEAPLSKEAAPDVVMAIRGDSTWLNGKRIVKSILDKRNSASTSRRFWYNQITATEDAWVSRQEFDRLVDASKVVADGSIVTLGADWSLSDDHSAILGCDVEQDHLFAIEVFYPNSITGEIDRGAADSAVRLALAKYDVVGFFSDVHPMESYVDAWAQEFGEQFCVKASPKSAVGFDMRSRGKDFTLACENFHDAMIEQVVTFDGDGRVAQHFYNARRAPNAWGVSIRKEHRESARKIDSVPSAVLARLARNQYLALPANRRRQPKPSGDVWIL